ncbi:MAG TPA: hypothetical protein ENI20_11545 [Bacteroides sp.]|nr:hypothetical protein [Bacteroides sp.]
MKPEKVHWSGLILFSGLFFLISCTTTDDTVRYIDRAPILEPDYAGVTIPQNVAPMNFIVKEEANSFMLEASSSNGRNLSIKSSDEVIKFPVKSWNKLLSENQGGEIILKVQTLDKEKVLTQYDPVYLYVANEPIDPYLCYRLLYPGYESWSQIEIIQRNIEDFDESSLVENQMIENNCVNCHSFNKNNPDKFKNRGYAYCSEKSYGKSFHKLIESILPDNFAFICSGNKICRDNLLFEIEVDVIKTLNHDND